MLVGCLHSTACAAGCISREAEVERRSSNAACSTSYGSQLQPLCASRAYLGSSLRSRRLAPGRRRIDCLPGGQYADARAFSARAAAPVVTQSGQQRHSSRPELSDLGLQTELLPKHIAVIMDGNGRWAQQQGRHESYGHQRGVQALRQLVELCAGWNLRCLTVYAFSSENWARQGQEVALLLRLIESSIDAYLTEMQRNGVRIGFIGDRASLPQSLQKSMARAEHATAQNEGLQLSVAVSYGGRSDIARAAAEIANLVAQGDLHPSQVTEQLVSSHLGTGHLPPELRNPDLVIRPGGEQRLSNFLLYESAYSELFFCHELWPDFDEHVLVAALRHYAARQRRYGRR